MRKSFMAGSALLFSGVMGALSGCTTVDVKAMSYKDLTECAASSDILRNAVACSEELENRNVAKPKRQNRPENKKVSQIVDLLRQENNNRMQAST